MQHDAAIAPMKKRDTRRKKPENTHKTDWKQYRLAHTPPPPPPSPSPPRLVSSQNIFYTTHAH